MAHVCCAPLTSPVSQRQLRFTDLALSTCFCLRVVHSAGSDRASHYCLLIGSQYYLLIGSHYCLPIGRPRDGNGDRTASGSTFIVSAGL